MGGTGRVEMLTPTMSTVGGKSITTSLSDYGDIDCMTSKQNSVCQTLAFPQGIWQLYQEEEH